MDNQDNLKRKLWSLKNNQFTGRLEIKSSDGKEWKLYFCLSRLVWTDGGTHPYRSWQRLLSQYCPQVEQNKLDLQEATKFECWNYHLIVMLLERSLIQKEQAVKLIEARILETLFDIFQAEVGKNLNFSIIPVSSSFLWQSGLKVSLTSLTIEKAIKQVQLRWIEWQKQELTNWSPNSAPILRNLSYLQTQFSHQTYQKLTRLLNGKYPLRELANKLNQDLLTLVVFLKNYLNQGLIDLIEVPDLPLKIILGDFEQNYTQTSKKIPQKLIVCIDDSLQTCQIMKHIVNQQGYKFVGIQEPLKALSQLLKLKPDLIFLDLVMPVINGHEFCAQIRRVSQLKNIPIIVLTSNNGIIDRVRSKFVGSSSFLTKPINEEKVIAKINYFVGTETNQSSKTAFLDTVKLHTEFIV